MLVIPIMILGMITAAGVAQHNREKQELDPVKRAVRIKIFETAINTTRDPLILRELAAEFRLEGMEDEAIRLEKRAALQELPKEVKKARREALKKALQSTNVDVILEMADVYDSQGCDVASKQLRDYAVELISEKKDVFNVEESA